MADLFNQQISATYSGLLKTSSSGVLSASLSQISDGRGNTSPLYLSTDSIQFYGAYAFPSSDGSANQVLKTDGAGVLTWEDDANSGTVTSVALSVPTGLTVTGSPITTNGTIAIGGTLGVANGGTGATTLTGILLGNGTSAISSVTDGTVGQVLSTNGSGTYSFIDAGTGDVTVDGASVASRVAVWNNTTGELRGTSAIATENSNIYLIQPSTNGTDKFNYIIGGAFAINENDFGIQNTGFGYRVLNSSDFTGNNNTAFGSESQTVLTTGLYNTSIGSFAMYDNRSGSYNVGLGGKTMFNQRISNYNVAIGYDSMDGVTASQTAVSDYNTAVGYQSLQSIQGGDNNTVIGKDSGNAITTGSNNVIIGSNTGSTIATSSNNIIISDGGGNIRQSFDFTGAATFNGAASFSGVVSTTSASSIGFLAQTTANSVYPYFRWVANNRSYWAAAIDSGTDATFKIGSGNTIGTGSLFEIDSGTNTATFSGNVTTGGTLTVNGTGNSAFAGQVFINGLANYTGLTLTGSGGSRPAINFNNVNNGVLGSIFGTEGNELIISANGISALTISSGGNADFSEYVRVKGDTAAPTTGVGIELAYNSTDSRGQIGVFDRSAVPAANGYRQVYFYGSDYVFDVGGVPKLTISSGGNVGIGTTTSLSKLNVNNASSGEITRGLGLYNVFNGVAGTGVSLDFYVNVGVNDRCARIISTQSTAGNYADLQFQTSDNAAPATRLTISSGGGVTMGYLPQGTGYDLQIDGGNLVFVLSTRKAKKNIEPIDIGLDFILSLEPVKYDLKQNDLSQVGFIAEDMPDERLQVIQPNDNNDLSKGYSPQSVNYKQITAPLVKAIQEQQTIIEDLKARIETLEG